MKIWIGGSLSRWDDLRANLFSIRDFFRNNNIEIVDDWLDQADKSHKTPLDKKIENYEYVINSIDKADIVVIEHSFPNYISGLQLSYAYQKKKPTIILRQFDISREYEDEMLNAFMETPQFKIKEYTQKGSLRTILTELLNDIRQESGNHRYNIVLNKKQKFYLDWASDKYKKSRSEIVRKLIEYGITNDELYRKYLNNELI